MIISILISIVMLFSSTIISNANNVDENRKAFDEFYEIVTAAYAAKGKEIFIEYDENHTYTQTDIDAMIELLENNEVVVDIVDSPETGKTLRLMPTRFYGNKTVTITSINGMAMFKLSFSGTLDLQGNNIISVDPLKFVYYAGLNYTHHSLKVDWTRSSNTTNTSCFLVMITGNVFFTATVLGIEYSVNEPVSKVEYIDSLDYIS